MTLPLNAAEAQPATAVATNDTRPAQGTAASPDVIYLASKAHREGDDPYRYLLILRFTLLNAFAFALLGVAYLQGYVEQVIVADRTHLSVVIFGVFLVGLGLCAYKVWQTSRDLNSLREYEPSASAPATQFLEPLLARDPKSRANLTGALRMKFAYRTAVVRQFANSLVLLGLIGTVVGFIIALSGVDPEHASDVKSIAPMVSTLIEGMSTALYTTLVGAVLNVWLMASHHLLAGGTVKLITATVEVAEQHARD